MFTQLLVLQKDMFTQDNLMKTKQDESVTEQIEMNDKIKYDDNIYHSFFMFYKYRTEKDIPSIDNIHKIWDDFYKTISYKSDFSQCFKYIYHEVETIVEYKNVFKDKKQKKYYARLIQATMNKDELFCYYINLLIFFYANYNSSDRRKHIKLLCDTEFFADICRLKDNEGHGELMKKIKISLNPNNPIERRFIDLINL